MKDLKIKRAIISLTDKSGVEEFAQGLVRHKVQILSTGGTAARLREKEIPVTDVAEVTQFPEILDGRVKTLHPRIYGGLLGLRDNPDHQAQMAEHRIEAIDLVVVNLYAFSRKVAEPGVTVEQAMGSVDIGGPSMIRAAAKNHAHVAVVTDPLDYDRILKEMDEHEGCLPEATRAWLAAKAFDMTAAYDAAIHTYLRKSAGEDPFPQHFTIPTAPGVTLRYGENPHQGAAFYPLPGVTEPSVSTAGQVNGKQLSYNNLLDTDAAFELVKEYDEPAAVMVKHTNPCGAAVGENILDAFTNAYAGDPTSAFGGIAALNRSVDAELAEVIADPGRFLEVLIAPDCSEEALEILRKKVKWGKNLRILLTGALDEPGLEAQALTFRSVTGGVLAQGRDVGIDGDGNKVVTEVKPDDATLATLRFAWKVVKHVRSNAIVLARDRMVVGVGAGQMSRIDSARLAGEKAGGRAQGAVLASDAFFPFRDCVDLAAGQGVKAIIQPGGSVRDKESIAAADEHGMSMVFTGTRHFKH